MANCSPHEKNNGSRGSVDRLTRRNLQSYTEKSRRDEAYRRGRSTPSSEPDLHEYNSLDSISAPPREAFKSVTAEQYAKVMKAARATDEWALRNDPNKDKILRELWPETDDTAVKSTAALEPSASSAQPTAIKNGRVAEEGLPAANQYEPFPAGDNCARDTASAEKSVETQPDGVHRASGEENDPIAPPFLNISPHRYNGEENQLAQPTAADSSPRPQQEQVASNPTLPP
ncbi:hypothetical protein NUW58_g6796 [Xylaria curta]|uniref:Uncharacterized protein n=1 Tax=Xylaria curta TaxID=42375 RepID=A0ACC1NQ64_9PEZI|nr:hypothetical protein NUW58_g6796 [Xylaria curta]